MSDSFKNMKIKALTIVSGTGVQKITVGIDGVTEISDRGIEYPDSIDFIYYVFSGDKIKTVVENCPVVIDYKPKEDSDGS